MHAAPKSAEEHVVSYLLRLWRVPGEQGPVLRAALRSSPDGEWVGFRDLDALVAALRAEMEEAGSPPPGQEP